VWRADGTNLQSREPKSREEGSCGGAVRRRFHLRVIVHLHEQAEAFAHKLTREYAANVGDPDRLAMVEQLPAHRGNQGCKRLRHS
jgi:hypothetical protein